MHGLINDTPLINSWLNIWWWAEVAPRGGSRRFHTTVHCYMHLFATCIFPYKSSINYAYYLSSMDTETQTDVAICLNCAPCIQTNMHITTKRPKDTRTSSKRLTCGCLVCVQVAAEDSRSTSPSAGAVVLMMTHKWRAVPAVLEPSIWWVS
jgi:hypothetical protein